MLALKRQSHKKVTGSVYLICEANAPDVQPDVLYFGSVSIFNLSLALSSRAAYFVIDESILRNIYVD